MIKRGITLFFIAVILILNFVSAQTLDETQKEIEESTQDLEQSVEALRNLTERDTWAYKAKAWKEIFLRNKAVAGVDAFFTKTNWFFLIFFGMNWSLSFAMFFAFLFWVFTFLSTYSHMKNFKDGVVGIFYVLIIVVLLAQINLFEYVGKWVDTLVFYKLSLLWGTIFFLLILGVLIGMFYGNREIAKSIEKKRKKEMDEIDRHSKETFAKMVDAAVEGASGKH